MVIREIPSLVPIEHVVRRFEAEARKLCQNPEILAEISVENSEEFLMIVHFDRTLSALDRGILIEFRDEEVCQKMIGIQTWAVPLDDGEVIQLGVSEYRGKNCGCCSFKW